MKLYKILFPDRNTEDLILVCGDLRFAESFIDRLFGLIFRRIENSQGYVIGNCNSIHTLWMRYKIDVVFLNKNSEIIKIYESLKQFRMTPVIKNADCVIEFPEFTINSFLLKTGDKLKII